MLEKWESAPGARLAKPAKLWRELSQYAATWFHDPGVGFADLHAALAHAMAGNGDALERIVRNPKGPAADIVLPMATSRPRLRMIRPISMAAFTAPPLESITSGSRRLPAWFRIFRSFAGVSGLIVPVAAIHSGQFGLQTSTSARTIANAMGLSATRRFD